MEPVIGVNRATNSGSHFGPWFGICMNSSNSTCPVYMSGDRFVNPAFTLN